MQALYRAILRLYPPEYRAAFASEMIEVFEQASVNSGARSLPKRAWFAAREFTGLLKGVVSEHGAKWAAKDTYITSRCASRQDDELPAEIAEVRGRLEDLLRSMEFAIAHHDFPKARFYSNEERMTRALLERLIKQYGLGTQLIHAR